ncbi:phage holin family protein [Alloscardovia omnicolens]|uniref:phage holin family protein n=1 Tax=Alloscardovia omnicolens TaxID=419015 RepID=UPI003A750C9B
MKRFLINWLILTIATGITVSLLPGLHMVGNYSWISYGSFALFLALINASIKPILHIFTLPLTFLTFGLSALVVNTFCFEVASVLSHEVFAVGISSDGFGWSFIGAIAVSVVSHLLNMLAMD